MRFPEDVPVLTDGELTLRAHRADDADAVFTMCQDPELQRWTTVPVPYLREHAVQFVTDVLPNGWRTGGFLGWAIEYDGAFAGTIDLHGTGGGMGELGFSVAPWARGNGVMTRAVRLVLRHAFDVLGWERVVWRAFVGNWASRRVAWKTGFRGWVTVPGATVRGTRTDEWVASVGRDDVLEPRREWWTVPVLEGGGVRLRALRDSDARRVAEACNDERTQHWLTRMPSPYAVSDAEAFIASRTEVLATGDTVAWAVADPETDELLANVSVFGMTDAMDRSAGEIGYWAHPAARGRRVMTTAVGLVVGHAFTPVGDGGLGRRRLTLFAAEGNTASMHVAEANGFTRTGRQRQASPRRDGGFDDLFCYDLLAADRVPGFS